MKVRIRKIHEWKPKTMIYGIYGEELVEKILNQQGFRVVRERGFSETFEEFTKKQLIECMEYFKKQRRENGENNPEVHCIFMGTAKYTLDNFEEAEKKRRKQHEEHINRMLKKYGEKTIITMPDFKIIGKNIFVEVKSNTSSLNAAQKESFPKLIKNGFKIFIANPIVKREGNFLVMKDISWKKFQENGRLERISFDEFIKEVKE